MVSAIQNERRKDDRRYSWGGCSCLHMLEGGRKSIIACVASPRQSYNSTQNQESTSDWL